MSWSAEETQRWLYETQWGDAGVPDGEVLEGVVDEEVDGAFLEENEAHDSTIWVDLGFSQAQAELLAKDVVWMRDGGGKGSRPSDGEEQALPPLSPPPDDEAPPPPEDEDEPPPPPPPPEEGDDRLAPLMDKNAEAKEKKKKKKKKKKKPGRRTSLGGMLGKSVGVGGKKMNSMRKTVADKGHLTEVYEATEKATKAVVDATKLTEVMGASQEAAHFLGDKTGVNAIIDAAAELGHVVGDATGLSDVTDGLRIGLSDGLDPDALPQRSPKGKKELKRQVRVLSICQTNPKPTNPTGWPD